MADEWYGALKGIAASPALCAQVPSDDLFPLEPTPPEDAIARLTPANVVVQTAFEHWSVQPDSNRTEFAAVLAEVSGNTITMQRARESGPSFTITLAEELPTPTRVLHAAFSIKNNHSATAVAVTLRDAATVWVEAFCYTWDSEGSDGWIRTAFVSDSFAVNEDGANASAAVAHVAVKHVGLSGTDGGPAGEYAVAVAWPVAFTPASLPAVAGVDVVMYDHRVWTTNAKTNVSSTTATVDTGVENDVPSNVKYADVAVVALPTDTATAAVCTANRVFAVFAGGPVGSDSKATDATDDVALGREVIPVALKRYVTKRWLGLGAGTVPESVLRTRTFEEWGKTVRMLDLNDMQDAPALLTLDCPGGADAKPIMLLAWGRWQVTVDGASTTVELDTHPMIMADPPSKLLTHKRVPDAELSSQKWGWCQGFWGLERTKLLIQRRCDAETAMLTEVDNTSYNDVSSTFFFDALGARFQFELCMRAACSAKQLYTHRLPATLARFIGENRNNNAGVIDTAIDTALKPWCDEKLPTEPCWKYRLIPAEVQSTSWYDLFAARLDAFRNLSTETSENHMIAARLHQSKSLETYSKSLCDVRKDAFGFGGDVHVDRQLAQFRIGWLPGGTVLLRAGAQSATLSINDGAGYVAVTAKGAGGNSAAFSDRLDDNVLIEVSGGAKTNIANPDVDNPGWRALRSEDDRDAMTLWTDRTGRIAVSRGGADIDKVEAARLIIDAPQTDEHATLYTKMHLSEFSKMGTGNQWSTHLDERVAAVFACNKIETPPGGGGVVYTFVVLQAGRCLPTADNFDIATTAHAISVTTRYEENDSTGFPVFSKFSDSSYAPIARCPLKRPHLATAGTLAVFSASLESVAKPPVLVTTPSQSAADGGWSFGARTVLDDSQDLKQTSMVAITRKNTTNEYCVAAATNTRPYYVGKCMSETKIFLYSVTTVGDTGTIDSPVKVGVYNPDYDAIMATLLNFVRFDDMAVCYSDDDNSVIKVAWALRYEDHDKKVVQPLVDVAKFSAALSPTALGYVGRKYHIRKQISRAKAFVGPWNNTDDFKTEQARTAALTRKNHKYTRGAWTFPPDVPLDTTVVAQAVSGSCVFFLCYKTCIPTTAKNNGKKLVPFETWSAGTSTKCNCCRTIDDQVVTETSYGYDAADADAYPAECLFLLRAWIVPGGGVRRDPSYCQKLHLPGECTESDVVIAGMAITPFGGVRLSAVDANGKMFTWESPQTMPPCKLELKRVAESILLTDNVMPQSLTVERPFVNVWPLVMRLRQTGGAAAAADSNNTGWVKAKIAAAHRVEAMCNGALAESSDKGIAKGTAPQTWPTLKWHTTLQPAARAVLTSFGIKDMLARVTATFDNEPVVLYAKVSLLSLETEFFVPAPGLKKFVRVEVDGTPNAGIEVDWTDPDSADNAEGKKWMRRLEHCSCVELPNLEPNAGTMKLDRWMAPDPDLNTKFEIARPASAENELENENEGGADPDVLHWIEGGVQVETGVGGVAAANYNKAVLKSVKNYIAASRCILNETDDFFVHSDDADDAAELFADTQKRGNKFALTSQRALGEVRAIRLAANMTSADEDDTSNHPDAVVVGVVCSRWGLLGSTTLSTARLAVEHYSNTANFMPTVAAIAPGAFDVARKIVPLDATPVVKIVFESADAKTAARLTALGAMSGFVKAKEQRACIDVMQLKTHAAVHPLQTEGYVAIAKDPDKIKTFATGLRGMKNVYKQFGFLPSMTWEPVQPDDVVTNSNLQYLADALKPHANELQEKGMSCVWMDKGNESLKAETGTGRVFVVVRLQAVSYQLGGSGIDDSIVENITGTSAEPAGTVVAITYEENGDVFKLDESDSAKPSTGLVLVFDVKPKSRDRTTPGRYMVVPVRIDESTTPNDDDRFLHDIVAKPGTKNLRVKKALGGGCNAFTIGSASRDDTYAAKANFKAWIGDLNAVQALHVAAGMNALATALDPSSLLDIVEAKTFGMAWAIQSGNDDSTATLMCPTKPLKTATCSFAELWGHASEQEREMLAKKGTRLSRSVHIEYYLDIKYDLDIEYDLEHKPTTSRLRPSSFKSDLDQEWHSVRRSPGEPFGNADNATTEGMLLMPDVATSVHEALPLSAKGGTIKETRKGVTPPPGSEKGAKFRGTLACYTKQPKHEAATINSADFGKWCADRCAGFFYPDDKLVKTGLRAVLVKVAANEDKSPHAQVQTVLARLYNEKDGGVAYIRERAENGGGGPASAAMKDILGGDAAADADFEQMQPQREAFFAVAASAHEKFPVVKPVAIVLAGGGITPTLMQVGGWYTTTRNYNPVVKAVVNDVNGVARRSDITEKMCIHAAPVQLGVAVVEHALIQCATLDFGLHFKDRQALKQSTAQKKTAVFAIAREINKMYPKAGAAAAGAAAAGAAPAAAGRRRATAGLKFAL